MTLLRTSILALSLAALTASSQQPYKVVDHWKIGGSGGWDYLTIDASAHRLYLTHGTQVDVVDTTTGKAVGAITGLKGTHGVALSTDGQTGFISDGRANQVVVFDRKSLATLGSIAAGTNPDAILFEPTTKAVWAFNGRSSNISVLDPATKTAVATIPLAGKPEFAQTDGSGHVFVNLEDKNSIVALDAASHSVTATWPLTGCDSPSGLAIDVPNHRLFAVCDGKHMAVVDYTTGKQLATATIGDGPDAAAYSPTHQYAFSSNGEGTVSVVDAAHGYKTLQTLTTQKGARTMAFDDSTNRAYVVTADFGPPPAPTAAVPHPRAQALPDSFTVLVIAAK